MTMKIRIFLRVNELRYRQFVQEYQKAGSFDSLI